MDTWQIAFIASESQPGRIVGEATYFGRAIGRPDESIAISVFDDQNAPIACPLEPASDLQPAQSVTLSCSSSVGIKLKYFAVAIAGEADAAYDGLSGQP